MSGTRRNANEVYAAREKADSTLCCWMVVAVFAVILVGVVAIPNESGLVNRPHENDNDDDGWSFTKSDDDDDDDGSKSHRLVVAAAPVAAKLVSRAPKGGVNLASAESVVLSHDSVLHSDYLGVHPKFVGCHADEDHISLKAASTLSLDESAVAGYFVDSQNHEASKYVNTPTAKVAFDEEAGTIVFTVDVPYLPLDAAYLLSFEPFTNSGDRVASKSDLLHAPGGCQNLPPLKGTEKYVDVWAHSPNAFYNASAIPRAVTTRGGAYATANGWKFTPTSCARGKYTWATKVHTLKHCTSADGAILVAVDASSKNVAVVSGTLWLNLLWPNGNDGENIRYMQWPFSFALYVDTFESKIGIIDSVRRTNSILRADADSKVKIAAAQKAAAAVVVSGAASEALPFIGVQWTTFTTLVDSWFTPEHDGENTTVSDSRGLRIRVRVTSTSTTSETDMSIAAKYAPKNTVSAIVKTLDLPTTKTATYGEFKVEHVPIAGDTEIQCVRDSSRVECYHNVTFLLTPNYIEVYQGSFDVYLCSDGVNCEILNVDHSIHIDVAVTDPSADIEEVDQLQISVSAHLNSASAARLDENAAAFDGGDRVCIQSYAVGPPQLTQSIDLRTISAWLCADDKPESKEESPALPTLLDSKLTDSDEFVPQKYLKSRATPSTGCSSRKHRIQLVGSKDKQESEIVALHYGVTVHEPGSYGSWSTAVCFNSSTIFYDSAGNSVHRPHQYVQTEVVAVPTEKRRHTHKTAVNVIASSRTQHRAFLSLSLAAETSVEEKTPHSLDAISRVKSIQDSLAPSFEILTSPELGKMLQTLDANGKLSRFNGVSIEVTPHTRRERQLHNVRESTALWMSAYILIIGIIIACPVIWCFIVRNPRVTSVDDDDENVVKPIPAEPEAEEDNVSDGDTGSVTGSV